MRRIFFITRTYDMEESKISSLKQIRNCEVNILQQAFPVIVVTPNYNQRKDICNDEVISLGTKYTKKDLIFERIGILEDYLDNWVNKTVAYLSNIVTDEDILFATSGGEMACIKIASILKHKCGCKFVVNFHDPVLYTHVDQYKLGWGPHVARDVLFKKYMENVDFVITSSETYRQWLIKIFPRLDKNSKTLYFGYISHANNIVDTEIDAQHEIVYAGAMNAPQNIERIIEMVGKKSTNKVIFIGEASKRILIRGGSIRM